MSLNGTSVCCERSPAGGLNRASCCSWESRSVCPWKRAVPAAGSVGWRAPGHLIASLPRDQTLEWMMKVTRRRGPWEPAGNSSPQEACSEEPEGAYLEELPLECKVRAAAVSEHQQLSQPSVGGLGEEAGAGL